METFIVLSSVVFVVAIWNASVGPSGAITFVTMATMLPPPAVVPLHAAVEALSGASRVALLSNRIRWQFVSVFCLFGLVGFTLGIPVLSLGFFSDDLLRVILGTSILVTTWLPIGRMLSGVTAWIAAGGFATTFMTLFIGATSPLVGAFVQKCHSDHRDMLATSSACMVFQHFGKIIIFGVLGFSFSQYGALLGGLISASIAGTWVGREILINVNQRIMRALFKTIVTILGIKLLWNGLA